MEPENRGFIDTATSIAQTAASAVKTVTNAMSGNYIGAIVSVSQSPFFRKLIACILASFILDYCCLLTPNYAVERIDGR